VGGFIYSFLRFNEFTVKMRDYKVVGLCVLMIVWALFLCSCADKPIVLEKNCTADIDCSVNGSRCADGVDPYHVCSEGKCVNLTFFADPCRMSHVCPKGNWDLLLDGQCFKERRCQETGCDDGSNDTIDLCINQNLRYEGCRYTVKNESTCVTDADCVPEQCCHPTSCINSGYKGVCDVMCTMVCMGPMDCGAGSCACINNKCAVRAATKTK
jgi:hypothetical protein